MSLAVLPLDLDQELRSSREMLSQALPKGIRLSQIPKKGKCLLSVLPPIS